MIPGVKAMARHLSVAAVVLLLLNARGPINKGDCSSGDIRCRDNALQHCYADEAFGYASWHAGQACLSPQVCRVNTADGSLGAPNENGCFDRNAYCTPGSGACYSTETASSVWSCVLRASDQTFRWSKTICSAQSPPTTCFDAFLGQANPGCYEAVRKCTHSMDHCEGSVTFTCSDWPVVVDNKAVFDWITRDCALDGQVRKMQASGPGCDLP